MKNSIIEDLKSMQDIEYREFNSKLIPTVDKEKIIGIRVPILRKYAKTLLKERNDEVKSFLNKKEYVYFEEKLLYLNLIRDEKDFEKAMELVERFLPFIDNWAICDSPLPNIFKKYPNEVYEKVKKWIKSEKVYTVRYAIGVLLSNFLDDSFCKDDLLLVSSVKNEDYYVKMMIAWYFSFALIKQYEFTIKYIEKPILNKWTHNKAIQKAIESRRIDKETKEYLKNLKMK